MIKKPIPIFFNLDGKQSVQSVSAVIHIDDNHTEALDLSLLQGGEHIKTPSNSTVTARFVRVKDKILISDNVHCTVQENGNILIPIDNAAAKMLTGEIKIEVNITDDNDILTTQFPLVIRINNTILADSEISPESEGTFPELLEETKRIAAQALETVEGATEALGEIDSKISAIAPDEIVYDDIAYHDEDAPASTNHLMVFFGSASAPNISLNLPALTSADFGTIFHFEISFKQSDMLKVQLQETKLGGVIVYAEYTPIVSGETISFDYTMSTSDVTGFRMRMYENTGVQKVKVKITKDISVEKYTYPKSEIDGYINNLASSKQRNPTKETPVGVTWMQKKIIRKTGEITGLDDSHYAVTDAIPVNAGEAYRIKTRMNFSNGFFVFYDENDEVVYVESANNNTSEVCEYDGIITVPYRAISLYVASYNTASSPESTIASVDYVDDFSLNDYYKLSGSIDEMTEPKFVETEGTRISGWTLTNRGLPFTASGCSLLIFDVNGGDTIKISARPYFAKYYYCSFFSEDIEFDENLPNGGFIEEYFISGLKNSDAAAVENYIGVTVTVPNNAKKVIISGSTLFIPLAYTVSGYQIKRKWVGKKWCAVGDSITEKNNAATKNYTDYIAEATGIEVINMGQSGTGYKQEENRGHAFYQRINEVPTDSDVVTIFGSLNDAGYIYGDPLNRRTYAKSFDDPDEAAADKAIEDTRIPWNQGRYIDKNGKIVETTNTSYAVTDAIPVTSNKYYRIKTRMKYNNAFFMFKDGNTAESNVVYIERLNDTSDTGRIREYDNFIKAPNNANYLYVSTAVYGNSYETLIREDIIGTVDDGLVSGDVPNGQEIENYTTTICGCINSTINNLYKIMPTVNLGIISSIPWIQYNPFNSPSCILYIEALEAICKKRGIPFLNLFYESNLRPWNKEFIRQCYKHGNHDHPDEDAHKLFAPRIEAFLDTLLLH